MDNIFKPDWIYAPEVSRIADILGHENFYFVGGAVRDSLIGRPVSDVDIATRFLPEKVMALIKDAGFKVVPTGIEHGTVTAVIGKRHFEITTLRQDKETDGRHAKVAFVSDWAADAARRDFTINALYLNMNGEMLDYYDGRADLAEGIVRFIGDPAERIREDGLRILRFFRFFAHFGSGELDAQGLAAASKQKEALKKLSVERKAIELIKLLKADNPLSVIKTMNHEGIWPLVLEETDFENGFSELDNLIALEKGLGETSALRRLSALIPKRVSSVKSVSKRLRLSREQSAHLQALTYKDPEIRVGMDDKTMRRVLYRHGHSTFDDCLICSSRAEDIEAVKELLAKACAIQLPKLPVRGKDLVAFGIAPGPEVGQVLAEIENKWIESDFSLSKNELIGNYARPSRLN